MTQHSSYYIYSGEAGLEARLLKAQKFIFIFAETFVVQKCLGVVSSSASRQLFVATLHRVGGSHAITDISLGERESIHTNTNISSKAQELPWQRNEGEEKKQPKTPLSSSKFIVNLAAVVVNRMHSSWNTGHLGFMVALFSRGKKKRKKDVMEVEGFQEMVV